MRTTQFNGIYASKSDNDWPVCMSSAFTTTIIRKEGEEDGEEESGSRRCVRWTEKEDVQL
ncbi:hypothetical protein EV356DRAFT_504743 [Viridothelium virens]|uniref:Uncharacterized protein n=1 Tax=Viridothelium virens TaxID=1048519 RepID=A0A6A6H446_VIRVR|nr:hypothetical protein EV356DRAFT_504743 [Viridothelium virens]